MCSHAAQSALAVLRAAEECRGQAGSQRTARGTPNGIPPSFRPRLFVFGTAVQGRSPISAVALAGNFRDHPPSRIRQSGHVPSPLLGQIVL
jgi:hypothetical protein